MGLLRVPVAPMLNALGEDVSWTPAQGVATSLRAIVLRDVLLQDGDTQYYATVIDVDATNAVAIGDRVTLGTDIFEVTRSFSETDEGWRRAVLAPRRT